MSTILPPSDFASEMAAASLEWYLIHSQPSREKLAEARLREQGFKTLLPIEKIQKPNRHYVDRPWFSRYLFIHCDRTELGAVDYTRGVARVVRFGDEPAIVPEDIINALMDQIMAATVEASRPVDFQPRERVRVNLGRLYGCEGLFDKYISNKARAVILINAIAVTVEPKHIERVWPVAAYA